MPAYRRTWRVLVDQRHRKAVGIDARPARDAVPQRKEKRRQRRRHAARVLRVPEEGDSPASDDSTHFERRELDAGDRVHEGRLLIRRHEVAPISKAVRDDRVEERPLRKRHISVSHAASGGA